jgi:hypothetical protein
VRTVFGETRWLLSVRMHSAHLQHQVPPKLQYFSTKLHDVTSQKFRFLDVRFSQRFLKWVFQGLAIQRIADAVMNQKNGILNILYISVSLVFGMT